MAGGRTDAGAGWGDTLYRSAVPAAIGVLGSSVALDTFSVTADSQFIYARGAYALIGLGILAMVVSIVLVVMALAARGPGTPERQRGVIHLVVLDVTLAWFVIWWFARRGEPLKPTDMWIIGLSGLIVLAAAASHLWEIRPTSPPPVEAADPVAADSAEADS